MPTKRLAVARLPAAGVRQPGEARAHPRLAEHAAAAEDQHIGSHPAQPRRTGVRCDVDADARAVKDPPMATVTPPSPAVGDKGLKKDALGFVSSVVIGVASTAPGYSLAASLGFVVAVAGVGLQAPAVLLRGVHPDAADRVGVLLHEPRRPGLRHDVLLGHEGDGPVVRAGWAAGRSSSPTSS